MMQRAYIEDMEELKEEEKRKANEQKTSFVEKVHIDHSQAIKETEERGRKEEQVKVNEEKQRG